MYEMEYLTEADMPYFERLAKEGKAVIIEISDKALMDIDLSGFCTSGKIDQKELERVLTEKSEELKERAKIELAKKAAKDNARKERSEKDPGEKKGASIIDADTTDNLTDLRTILSRIKLSPEQWDVVSYAIENGITGSDMTIFLHENIPAEQMKRMADALIKRTRRFG